MTILMKVADSVRLLARETRLSNERERRSWTPEILA